MKKIISIFLSVIVAAGLCFGVAGCKEEGKIELPEATAEKPVFDICEKADYVKKSALSSQAEFLQYYYGDFKDISQSKFYILSPDGYDDIFLTQEFALYSNKSNEYRLQENLNIYDEELGRPQSDKSIGNYGKSLELAIVSIPQEQAVADEQYTIEFGELTDQDKSIFENYINIYNCEFCIATCYFKAYVSIQKSWFESFFLEKLWFADNLKENDFDGAVQISSAKASAPQTESIFNSNLKKEKEIYDYRKFNNYYFRDFRSVCNDKFFILRPQLNEIELNWVANTNFTILSDNIKPKISEWFWVNDKNIESPKDDFYDWSVFVNFVSEPVAVSRAIDKEFRLEFGVLGNGINFDYAGFGGSFTNYFNLYIGENFIGTCYYYSLVDISEKWFVDYISQNLFFGE